MRYGEEDMFLAELARSGTILDAAYTLPVCSPSRELGAEAAAIFTLSTVAV